MSNKKTQDEFIVYEPKLNYLGLNHEMGVLDDPDKYGLKKRTKINSTKAEDTNNMPEIPQLSFGNKATKNHTTNSRSKDRTKYGSNTQEQLDKLIGDLVSKAKYNDLDDYSSRSKVYNILADIVKSDPQIISAWVKGYRKPKDDILDTMLDYITKINWRIDGKSDDNYESIPGFGIYSNFAKDRSWELLNRLDAFVRLKYDDAKSSYKELKHDFYNYQYALPVEIFEYFEDFVCDYLEPEFTESRRRFRVFKDVIKYKEIEPCYPDNIIEYCGYLLSESQKETIDERNEDIKKSLVMFYFLSNLSMMK